MAILQDTTSVYAAIGGVALTYAIISFIVLPYLAPSEKYLRSQSWVGMKKQVFARFRAGMSVISSTPQLMLEGYEKYCKNGKPFILPQFSRDPFVVLPADQAYEFLSIGDDRVDHETVGRESIAHKWTVGPGFENSSHFDVVRRQLTRKLPLLTTDVYNELVLSMQRNWPVGKEWQTVNTYPTCMKIVSQAANRVFSGKVLCRNPEFLDSSRLYAQAVFKCGALMKLIPDKVQFLAAPMLTKDVKKHFAICKRIATPIIEERVQQMRTQGKSYQPHNDVLQWVLDDAFAVADTEPHRLTTDWLVRCLLLLNMVAIHTTSMISTSTIQDIYSSPHRDEIVAGLREECTRVLATSNGQWTKEAVNNLVRVDSVLRETMRVSSLGELGIPRIVKDPAGITLSGGIHLPQGVRVAVPSQRIHTDGDFYPDPLTWDGFRYSRPREEFLASAAGSDKADAARLDKILELKNRAVITTGDDFYSFGAQRHACPGRFFASQEMKLMIAYVVMNYDIKIDGGRPKPFQFNGASVPTDEAEMQIRLRQD